MTSPNRRVRAGARQPGLLVGGAILAACGALIAGCGSAAAPSAGSPASGTGAVIGPRATASASASAAPSNPSASGPSQTSASKVDLTIVQTSGPGSAPKRFTLRCAPAGGTYADATTACNKLLALKDIFRPQAGHVMCPDIMANARSYIVSGVFLGQSVHQSILDGGCTIAKWNQLNKIFN